MYVNVFCYRIMWMLPLYLERLLFTLKTCNLPFNLEYSPSNKLRPSYVMDSLSREDFVWFPMHCSYSSFFFSFWLHLLAILVRLEHTTSFWQVCSRMQWRMHLSWFLRRTCSAPVSLLNTWACVLSPTKLRSEYLVRL